MKPQPQLVSMLKNQAFDGFLLVRAAAQRTSSNGSKYLDMTLCDISAKSTPRCGTGWTPPLRPRCRLRGVMLEYNGRPQLRVDKLRPAAEGDDYDMAALAPCAPQPSGEMMDFILNRVDAIADRELKALVLKRLEEAGDRLMYYPPPRSCTTPSAEGFCTTSTMLRTARAVCDIYPFLDADLAGRGRHPPRPVQLDELTPTRSAWSAITPAKGSSWAIW